VQFTRDSHAEIAAGNVTLTFRRWARPQAKVGGRYRVGTVEIEVDHIDLVPFSSIRPRDLARTGLPDLDSLRRLAAHSGPIDDDTAVFRIEFHVVGTHSGPRTVAATPDNVVSTLAKLDAMDRRSDDGPWTHRILELIGANPGRVSTELAALVGRDRADFKTDVRKLKALGLTQSREVGYNLTELGNAVVRRSKGNAS
jgi:hypothetical protein